jgi:His/Glu/Gln/Arg/opine family amino acid ABC transporter permease subunit
LQYIPSILHGLWITILISFISLLIGAIPGALLFWGKKSRVKPVYWLSTIYVEIFEGIPLLAQLFFVFYVLPMVSPNLRTHHSQMSCR